MRTSRVHLSLLVIVAVLAMSVCLAATPRLALAAEGDLVDAGFENGTDGAVLATPPWTASGVPQHREYDNARARVGARSAWIQGASAGTNAGVWEAASGGMTSNGAELRAWLYFDTTTHSRLLEDYSAGLAVADRAVQIQFAPGGAINVITDRAGNPNGYTTGAFIPVGTYATGWTQFRIVFDFASQTYTLSKRASEAASWTQLKAAGAATYAIPFRGTNTIGQTHGTLWRGLGAAQLWLDDLRYADGGITDAPAPDTTPPDAPSTLSVIDHPSDQGGALDLSWAEATDDVGVTGYKLYRGTASGALTLYRTLPATTTLADDAATTGARSYYAVTAVDAAGNESARSPEASAIPADNLAPSVPTGLAAVGGTAQVSLSWTANAEADLLGYDVYRDGAKLTPVPVPASAFTDALLPAGTYSYSVAAVDTHGNASARCPAVSGTAISGQSSGDPGTLVDAGFETGADGALLSTPPWTASGVPQRREYDNARAKAGSRSAWIQGAAAGSNAGVYETVTGGMSANGAEVRAWLYFDTTTTSRLLEDYAAGVPTADRATSIQFAPDGTIKVLTDRAGNPNGYATGAYTSVGSYGTGWTQVRLVFNFASQTFMLSTRASDTQPWTQLKAAGSSGYGIPFRGVNTISATHGTLWRGLGAGQLWLDELRFSGSGITDPPPPHTIVASAGAGGSISPGGAVSVDDGTDSPLFTFIPATGYALLDVLVDGVSVGTPSSYRFTGVQADHTIAANFVPTGPPDMAVDDDCASCHAAHGNGYDCLECHDFGEQHPGTASTLHTPATVTACTPCHDGSLTVEHMSRTPDAGGAFECTTCHQSADPAVKSAIALHTSACGACHPNANHADAHLSRIATETLGATGLNCTACHDADLQVEHGKAASTSKVAGCDACHPSPRSTLTSGWAKSCVQSGCHAAATPQAMHGSIDASHAPSPANASCMATGCHASKDLASLHSLATTEVAGVTRTSCMICHTGGLPTTKDCATCHGTVGADGHAGLAVHTAPVSDYESCGHCHHGWGSNPLRGQDVKRHAGGCTTCHNDTMDLTGKTAHCADCHTTEGTGTPPAGYHRNTTVIHSPADPGSLACADCHETTNVRELHTTLGCQTCHVTYTCTECHSMHNGSPGTPLLSAMSCTVTCHETAGTDYHRSQDASHTFSAMEPGCISAGCHPSNDLVTVHASYVGTGTANPGYADGCHLCHANADPERVPEDATAACSSCHQSYHADMDATHVSPTTSACFGAGCHDSSKSLPAVHASYAGTGTEFGYATTCELCHGNRTPGRIDWSTATAACTGVCHSGSTHSQYAARHTITSASAGCTTGSGCHSGDLSSIHKAGPSDWSKCAVCHGRTDNWAKAADCAGCHTSPTSPDYHGDLTASHTSATSCFGSCHTSRIDAAAHVADCLTCHDSAAQPVTTAIADGRTDCGACHRSASSYVDAAGRAYVLVGAKHDGIRPAITSVNITFTVDPANPTVSWTTDRPCTTYVDYTDADWSYDGSNFTGYQYTAGSASLSTTHSVTFPAPNSSSSSGYFYWYRIRTIDAQGNVAMTPQRAYHRNRSGDTAYIPYNHEPDYASLNTNAMNLRIVRPDGSRLSTVAAEGWESQAPLSQPPTPSQPGSQVSADRLAAGSDIYSAWWQTKLATADGVYNWQLTRFSLDADAVRSMQALEFRWNGYAENSDGHPVVLYAWNFDSAAWERLDSRQSGGMNSDTLLVDSSDASQHYCQRCHAATPVSDTVTMPGGLANIRATYATDFHGTTPGSGYGGSLKAPYARGQAALPCDACHEPSAHGSGTNPYKIRSAVNGSAVSVTSGTTAVSLCVACHEGTPNDFHATCISCHTTAQPNYHNWTGNAPEDFTGADCLSCHKHGTTAYAPGCHSCHNETGAGPWTTF